MTVAAAGGTICDGRLGDCLAVTRSFGDAFHAEASPSGGAAGHHGASAASSVVCRKLGGLTATPECRSEQLQGDDEFVILASDGLWDAMSSEDAVRIVRSELAAYDDPQIAAEKLVETAARMRTDDNITVSVVTLFAPPPPSRGAGLPGRGGLQRSTNKPVSFVHLNTPASFVRVVGGFG